MKKEFSRSVSFRFLKVIEQDIKNEGYRSEREYLISKGISPSKFSEIRKAKANVTLEDIASLLAKHPTLSGEWILKGIGKQWIDEDTSINIDYKMLYEEALVKVDKLDVEVRELSRKIGAMRREIENK